jgi:hypothetical protein
MEKNILFDATLVKEQDATTKILKDKLGNFNLEETRDKEVNTEKITYWRIGASLGFFALLFYSMSKKNTPFNSIGIGFIGGLVAGGIAYNIKG